MYYFEVCRFFDRNLTQNSSNGQLKVTEVNGAAVEQGVKKALYLRWGFCDIQNSQGLGKGNNPLSI